MDETTVEVPMGQHLKKIMFHTESKDAVVQILGDNCMPRGNVDFESQLSRHRAVSLVVSLLGSKASMNFTGSVFFYPRCCGQRVLWSLVDLVGNLGVKTHGNKAST